MSSYFTLLTCGFLKGIYIYIYKRHTITEEDIELFVGGTKQKQTRVVIRVRLSHKHQLFGNKISEPHCNKTPLNRYPFYFSHEKMYPLYTFKRVVCYECLCKHTSAPRAMLLSKRWQSYETKHHLIRAHQLCVFFSNEKGSAPWPFSKIVVYTCLCALTRGSISQVILT